MHASAAATRVLRRRAAESEDVPPPGPEYANAGQIKPDRKARSRQVWASKIYMGSPSNPLFVGVVLGIECPLPNLDSGRPACPRSVPLCWINRLVDASAKEAKTAKIKGVRAEERIERKLPMLRELTRGGRVCEVWKMMRRDHSSRTSGSATARTYRARSI